MSREANHFRKQAERAERLARSGQLLYPDAGSPRDAFVGKRRLRERQLAQGGAPAVEAVARRVGRAPGLGHRVHTTVDPRTAVLFTMAREVNIALGAEQLAREASLNGVAEGEISAGQISMLKLGAGSTFALLAVFAVPADTSGVDSEATDMAPKTSDSAPSTIRPPRLPLRFVWQTAADGRFSLATQEFPELLGPKTSTVLDRTWAEIAQTVAVPGDVEDELRHFISVLQA
jgi:hypothetical protein